MGRRRDALLTVAVFAPLLAAGVFLDAPLDPAAAVVGAVGTLAAEGLLALDAPRVRRAWGRPVVQSAAVVAAFVAAALGVAAVGPAALTALLAALGTYLFVLAAVSLRDATRGA